MAPVAGFVRIQRAENLQTQLQTSVKLPELSHLFAQTCRASVPPHGRLGFGPRDHVLEGLPSLSGIPVAISFGLFRFLQTINHCVCVLQSRLPEP